MSIIADRRAVLLALCAFVALESAASAADSREAGWAKPNAALAALQAGPWGEKQDDSFRVVPAGYDFPTLTPPTLTPPILTQPTQWATTPTPVPVEIRPIEIARPAEPVAAFPAYSYVEPCRDLRNKAALLRTAAGQCDIDLANGHPTCFVEPTFSTPRIPRRLTPSDARWYAADFEARVLDSDERACKSYGAEGVVPVNGGDPGPTQAYARWYKRLCDQGDEYACDARQITLLCFDNSYVNSCVRRCLVDNDPPCVATNDPHAKLDCRRKNHWLCYEASCPKFVPSPIEVACFSRFKKWKNFLLPPGLTFGGGY